MKKHKLSLVLATLPLLFLLSACDPFIFVETDYYVPGDFPTIREAIDFAEPGDTVFIENGIYSPSTNGEFFPIFVKDGVNVQGEAAQDTILDAEGTAHVLELFNYDNGNISNLTLQGGDDSQGAGIYIENSNSTLQNLYVLANRASQSGSGIYVKNSNGLSLTNLVVADNANTGSSSNQAAQVEIDDSNITFTNNVVASGDSDGLRLNFGANGDFKNNIFFDNGFAGNGVGFADTDTSTTANISYNICFANSEADFYLNGMNLSAAQANDLSGSDAIDNNFSADPLFNNPNADDYSLASGSPARHAGDPNPAFDNPDGSRNDIGVFGGPESL